MILKKYFSRFSKLSHKLLTFDLDNHYWSEVHYPPSLQNQQDPHKKNPLERAFHTALITGNIIFFIS